MAEVVIMGLGTWSPRHADWQGFCAALASGEWPDEVKLLPDLIPPRERRRAPQLVKMAIEVMDQACKMASVQPADVAVIFSSAMGDMQITDYMCSTLAQEPRLISPTKFHNSVHNAAPGYWSIATGSFCPTSAVSAFELTPSMAFLEAAIQCVEEQIPVIAVTQEVAAPYPLMDICPCSIPFSAAFLIAPSGFTTKPICTIDFSVTQDPTEWPVLDPRLAAFESNMSARLLPLMTSIAEDKTIDLCLPLTDSLSLSLSLS